MANSPYYLDGEYKRTIVNSGNSWIDSQPMRLKNQIELSPRARGAGDHSNHKR